MRAAVKNYYENLFSLVNAIRVTDRSGRQIDFHEGIELACKLIAGQTRFDRKILFIGNGASAAISSHMAADFWKNGGMRTATFTDLSLLTAVGNDHGYEHVFETPSMTFADAGDVLIAISSSGRSSNILLGVEAGRSKGCKIITLSGFDYDNPLCSMGEINFYVPAKYYGPVEVVHHSICHCMLDTIVRGIGPGASGISKNS
jgi:D-sedoheptulose 7-phosphate isomerase